MTLGGGGVRTSIIENPKMDSKIPPKINFD
jgi:hypothetical protein